MAARGQGMLPNVSRQLVKSELVMLAMCDGPIAEAASPEAIKMSQVKTIDSMEGILSKLVVLGS